VHKNTVYVGSRTLDLSFAGPPPIMSAYIHIHNLASGHSDTVNCLAFSSDARYLASGSDDHSMVIWNVANGAAMYRLAFVAPVRCLLWHPIRVETLICGLADGTVYEANKFSLVSASLFTSSHKTDSFF
jgi:WD40 repeat protein